jgi:hypothetical protein
MRDIAWCDGPEGPQPFVIINNFCMAMAMARNKHFHGQFALKSRPASRFVSKSTDCVFWR